MEIFKAIKDLNGETAILVIVPAIIYYRIFFCENCCLSIAFNFCSNACEFPRSWLLPVMRDHVRGTEMIFFFEYFVPLADKLRGKGEYFHSINFLFW